MSYPLLMNLHPQWIINAVICYFLETYPWNYVPMNLWKIGKKRMLTATYLMFSEYNIYQNMQFFLTKGIFLMYIIVN